jgi:hypothetical protein
MVDLGYWILPGLLDSEDGGTAILRNVSNYWPKDPRRLASSATWTVRN